MPEATNPVEQRSKSLDAEYVVRVSHMGLVVVTTAGLVVWLVMWALGVKAIDSFMITVLLVVLGATARIIAPYLPGNRDA